MPSLDRYALRIVDRGGRRVVDALGRRLPRVGLDGVLGELDRQAQVCPVPGDAAGDGFTWETGDRDDRTWWPQGVAALRGGDVLLTSWYAKRRWFVRTHGSRVSVVDRSDPGHPRYRHVLLVTPRRWPRLTLGAVPVHAGGIAVLGDLLYVADTWAGVRVFALSDLAAVPERPLDRLLPWRGAGTRTLGRRLTGGFTAYGYGHVLPQRLRLRVPRRSGLKWSFLSVGEVEGRLSLVVGEYGRKGSTPRLARYPLDPATGLPVLGPDGRCLPLEVHSPAPLRMQGVAVHGSRWWVSASSGEGRPGDLHVGAPGAFRRHRGVLPPGPEDLDWARPGEQLWGLSEWPGHRYVFPVATAPWDGPGATAT
jgi:hypothetical protein